MTTRPTEPPVETGAPPAGAVPADPVAPPQGAPSTAVATSEPTPSSEGAAKDESADVMALGDLPPAAKERLAIMRAQLATKLSEERALKTYAAASSKITWARNLDPDQLMRLAGWAREGDLDLLTEFHLLGGSAPYVNAKWYIRQLGNLVALGEIEYAYYEMVHRDARLEDEAAELRAAGARAEREAEAATSEEIRAVAKREAIRNYEEAFALDRMIRDRRRARLEHGLPEEALAAVVWHVKSRRMEQEVVAAQAVGGYRGTGKENKPKDPVGEEFPRETAITRGCRKAMLALAHVAPALERKEAEARAAAARIAELLPELDAAGLAQLRTLSARTPVATPADPYAPETNTRGLALPLETTSAEAEHAD